MAQPFSIVGAHELGC